MRYATAASRTEPSVIRASVTTDMWLPPASRHAAISPGHWLSRDWQGQPDAASRSLIDRNRQALKGTDSHPRGEGSIGRLSASASGADRHRIRELTAVSRSARPSRRSAWAVPPAGPPPTWEWLRHQISTLYQLLMQHPPAQIHPRHE